MSSPTKTTQPERRSYTVHIPATCVPQDNGTVLVLPGRPRLVAEVTVVEFARATAMSRSSVLRLCNEGLLQFRRLTMCPGSKFLIPFSEIARLRNFHD